jgi:DNA-binding XRE family transcriptional regulator
MCFSAAASSENAQGSMNLASNTAPVPSTMPSRVSRHPSQHRVPNLALNIADGLAGIALEPAPIEVLGRRPELYDEVVREVLGLNLAALLAPEPKEGMFVFAHDNAGVRAANGCAAIRPSKKILFVSSHLQYPRMEVCIDLSYRLLPRQSSPLVIQKGLYCVIQKGSRKTWPVMTIEQLRAARGLLGWSQSELASRAGLSLPTVKRFEGGFGPKVSDDARAKLQRALESAGVEFIDENGGGPGVRLRKPPSTKIPK